MTSFHACFSQRFVFRPEAANSKLSPNSGPRGLGVGVHLALCLQARPGLYTNMLHASSGEENFPSIPVKFPSLSVHLGPCFCLLALSCPASLSFLLDKTISYCSLAPTWAQPAGLQLGFLEFQKRDTLRLIQSTKVSFPAHVVSSKRESRRNPRTGRFASLWCIWGSSHSTPDCLPGFLHLGLHHLTALVPLCCQLCGPCLLPPTAFLWKSISNPLPKGLWLLQTLAEVGDTQSMVISWSHLTTWQHLGQIHCHVPIYLAKIGATGTGHGSPNR